MKEKLVPNQKNMKRASTFFAATLLVTLAALFGYKAGEEPQSIFLKDRWGILSLELFNLNIQHQQHPEKSDEINRTATKLLIRATAQEVLRHYKNSEFSEELYQYIEYERCARVLRQLVGIENIPVEASKDPLLLEGHLEYFHDEVGKEEDYEVFTKKFFEWLWKEPLK